MTNPIAPLGQPSDGPPGPPTTVGAPPPSTAGTRRFSWGDFFAFRVMVTPVLIRMVYVIGVVIITLAAFLPLVGAPATVCEGAVGGTTSCTSLGPGPVVGALLYGIVILIVGQLLWRVMMELLIVIFGIHESARSIEAQGRR